MRIYLPLTVSDLRSPAITARQAYAVTDEVRGLAPGEDEEGLEYLAFLAAADAAIDEAEVSRIVIAADSPGTPTGATGVVQVPEIAWEEVVSIHIDDMSDAELLADLNAAQTGDDSARDRVNEADLLWYDTGERQDVIALIAAV